MVQEKSLHNSKIHETVKHMPITCPCCEGKGSLETGPELRKIREKSKKSFPKRTLVWVAGRMGVAPSYLSDLEKGKRDWNADLIKRFKEALK